MVVLITVLLAAWLAPATAVSAQRRWVVAFANATEEPGVTLEGTGFTGPEVRESFNLAARLHPIDLVFYDNRGDDARAVANAEAAIARKVDLYVQYHRGPSANAIVAQKLKAAGIPVLAVNHPVPGAPLYTIDNAAAGPASLSAGLLWIVPGLILLAAYEVFLYLTFKGRIFAEGEA